MAKGGGTSFDQTWKRPAPRQHPCVRVQGFKGRIEGLWGFGGAMGAFFLRGGGCEIRV